VEHLAQHGVKEIVLTGVNLGDFSPPTPQRGDSAKTPIGEEQNFFSLIKELEKVEGIQRYRISSIEPNLLTNEIIEFVANSDKFMPHFHIPLQSGSNRILGLMHRRYKRELYAERVSLIKALMPHCCIGVDVIVGFPSETDEDFKETFDLLHSLDISYLHVFTYSERDNTHALKIKPVVPMQVRHERNKSLRNLSYMKMQYFTEQHRGQARKVLFEGHENRACLPPAWPVGRDRQGMMEGYTDNYIKITTPFRKEWVNEIVEWKI
jgi:threonylcarbamoyladenosine tRNA methylthiotransferase MtaB